MFNFNGIDHLNIKVKDLKESIEFYQKVFGFEVKEEGVSPMSGLKFSIIGLSGKAMLAIYEDPNINPDKSSLAHIGFNIDFNEDMESYLKENGVKINYYGDNAVINYPNSKSIYIEDPSGYEIELSSNFGGDL